MYIKCPARKGKINVYPVSILRTIVLVLILFTPGFAFLSAQEKISKGLQLIEIDKAKGLLTAEEALVQKFFYGFNKSKFEKKYFFENDIPGKCGTPIFAEYKQKKNLLSKSSIDKIESCIGALRKRALSEKKYTSPSGKFELTYSTEGKNAVSAEDVDSSGVPDYVENIASYFDYSWKYVVDTLGYHAPPVGEGKYQIIFENSGYYGYTEEIENKVTFISMSTSFSGLGVAKVTAIHEFMHACQIVYDNWESPSWFLEIHSTWVEDIGYDDVNDYYDFIFDSNIRDPSRPLTSGEGYADCIFMHFLTQKFGVQTAREIWERIEKYSWDAGLNNINAVLKNHNSSLKQVLPEYFSWCFLCGVNADSRLPSFKEAAYYPSSRFNEEFSVFPNTIKNPAMKKISGEFFKYLVNETSGNLCIEFSSYDIDNTLVLITYFKNNSVDIKYFPGINYSLLDTGYKLKEIDHFVIIPVNTNVFENHSYSLSVNKYRDVVFQHTPLSSSESISPKIITTNIKVSNKSFDYSTLKLNYKFGRGQFKTLRLLPTENWNEYSAEISGIAEGDTISYYFSCYDSLRNFNNTLPINAPDSLYSFMCGIDNIAPRISNNTITCLTKYDFPRRLFANISDNYNVASAYMEYNVNDKEMKRLEFKKLKDSLYYAPLFMDTTFCNNDDKISYRIIASDGAISNNTTTYPDSGLIKVTINRGFKYKSEKKSYICAFYNEYFDTLYVKDDISIKDLNIFFKASGVKIDSLLIKLTSPNGKQVKLKKMTSLNCDSLSVVFDDSAEMYFTSDNYFITDKNCITGHYKPDNNCLNEFNGLRTRGKWIMQISNLSWYNDFWINGWGLIVQADQNTTNMNALNGIGIPTEYSLSQNYPNPFNPVTTINYSLPKQSNVEIKIYDVLGKEIEVLVNEKKSPGSYKVHFDGRSLSSGVYFYRIITSDFVATKKMLLIK